MDKTSLIIQNRLREATVSLERAHLIYCDENWKCDYSVPPFSSIGLILQGEGVICIDKKPIHPTAGQLYLLPSNTLQTFSTSASDPYHKYFCHFEISCHETDLFELIHLPLCVDSPDPERSEALFREMIDALNGNDILSALKAKQALLNLLCHYMECCSPETISLAAQDFDSPLSNAILYVQDHLSEQITVSEMAQAAGYHVSHFTQLFQKQMGISPGQFIQKKKSDTAAQLLTSTDLPVAEIADSLGFSNPFYFSSFFKKQTGMTPSAYRTIYLRTYLQ